MTNLWTALVTGGSIIACATVAQAASTYQLTDYQLDAVTAGAVSVDGTSLAAAQGQHILTATNTTAVAVGTTGPVEGASVQAALISGGAQASGAGGDNSAATSVLTSGQASGSLTYTNSVNWTVNGIGGASISGGWTFVYADVGGAFLGAPR
jgi:hypothetical protein